MLVVAPNLDLGDLEDKIASLLAAGVDPDSHGQGACEQFALVLDKVFRLLPGNRQTRYWDLDDLSCDSADRTGDVVTLAGSSSWLAGGGECDRFRIDVALDQQPLVYSYKFTSSLTDKQILYVGKTPEGWLVNGPET
jgi:hypothetical protein